MSDWNDYAHGDGLGDAFWDAAAPACVHALCLLRHEGSIRKEIARVRHPGTAPARRLVDAVIQIPGNDAGFGSAAAAVLKLRSGRIVDRLARRAGFSPDPVLDECGDPLATRQHYRIANGAEAASLLAAMRLEQILDTVCQTIVDVPRRTDDPLRGIDRLAVR